MRKFSLILALIFCLMISLSVYGHSGKTDSNGGHYNHSTGEYHYHHGYPAHSHPNGICPYDYANKTGSLGTSTKQIDILNNKINLLKWDIAKLEDDNKRLKQNISDSSITIEELENKVTKRNFALFVFAGAAALLGLSSLANSKEIKRLKSQITNNEGNFDTKPHNCHVPAETHLAEIAEFLNKEGCIVPVHSPDGIYHAFDKKCFDRYINKKPFLICSKQTAKQFGYLPCPYCCLEEKEQEC